MLKNFIRLVLIFYPMFGYTAHFENLIELTVKIEDASFTHKIKSVEFNNEEIQLDPTDMFKPRKILKYKLSPGRYVMRWTTEKTISKWSDEPIKNFEKIVVLENGDGIVRINLKGDAISMY